MGRPKGLPPSGFDWDNPFGYPKSGPRSLGAEGTGGGAESGWYNHIWERLILVEHCNISEFVNMVLPH